MAVHDCFTGVGVGDETNPKHTIQGWNRITPFAKDHRVVSEGLSSCIRRVGYNLEMVHVNVHWVRLIAKSIDCEFVEDANLCHVGVKCSIGHSTLSSKKS